MATRYRVTWNEGNTEISQGFAFMPGAFEMWSKLVNHEAENQAEISGAKIEYLGPNGERWDDSAFMEKEGSGVGGPRG